MNEARVYRSAAMLLVLASSVGYCLSAYWQFEVPSLLIGLAALAAAVVCVFGEVARRKSHRIPENQDVYLGGASPPWIWMLGISLAIVATPGLLLNSEGQLVDFSARPAQSTSASERNGKYFAQDESGAERPISAEDFRSMKRTVAKFILLGVLWLAFIGLVLWNQELQYYATRADQT